MKNIAISLIVFLIAMSSLAQSSDHLTFKGVPIDGTFREYIAKMKQNGFTHLGTENGFAMLKGEFAGYKDCKIGVSTLKQKDLISKITVFFNDEDTWSNLSLKYYDLKRLLKQKYGEPSDCVEKFDTKYKPRNDAKKMHYVKKEKCKYYTTYKTDKGVIHLSIEYNNVLRCYVKLTYYDKINGEIIKAIALDDL